MSANNRDKQVDKKEKKEAVDLDKMTKAQMN